MLSVEVLPPGCSKTSITQYLIPNISKLSLIGCRIIMDIWLIIWNVNVRTEINILRLRVMKNIFIARWNLKIMISILNCGLATLHIQQNSSLNVKETFFLLHTQPEFSWTRPGLGNVILHGGCKTTLVYDVGMSFWLHDVTFDIMTSDFDVIFRQTLRRIHQR